MFETLGATMKLQRLLSLTRKAIDDYQLIEENDKIAIGISGGKDSLTLLCALAHLQKFYPIPFSICAITVDLGYPDFDTSNLSTFCNTLNVEYHVVKTDIADIIATQNNKKSPCSLCAKLRKGALNQKAIELNCNKVAYAHHKDDLIETMFLSLLYEGRFHSCSPKTHWDTTNLTLIRPLIYINEVDIIGFQNKTHLPISKNPCPIDGHTKRTMIRKLLKQLNQQIPGCKERMFHAILNGKFDDWPIPIAHPKHNMEQ